MKKTLGQLFRELSEAHEKAVQAAWHHAETCRACSRPIIADEEGNPGLASEACLKGAELLHELEVAETNLLKVGEIHEGRATLEVIS